MVLVRGSREETKRRMCGGFWGGCVFLVVVGAVVIPVWGRAGAEELSGSLDAMVEAVVDEAVRSEGDKTLEDRIRESPVILLCARHTVLRVMRQKIDEILYCQPGCGFEYKVGDRYPEDLEWKESNTEYGEGSIVFIRDLQEGLTASYEMYDGEIPGLDDMSLVELRRLIAQVKGTGGRVRRPNVLFIALDDMNDWVGHLGGYGGEAHTPNLDRLAERGVAFMNAQCAAPLCNPSRTAVMTGLRPSTTGVYDNGQWWRPALPDVVTMPEHFRANGYYAAGGGKIFHHTLGNNPPELWDEYHAQVQDSPWHYNYPVAGQHVAKKGVHWPDGFPLNGIRSVAEGKRPPGNYREFDWGPFDKADLEMGDGRTVQWALDFLGKPQSKPFFLAVGIYRPHLPWYAPGKYFDLYPLDDVVLPEVKDDDLDDVPEAGRNMAGARTPDFELVKETGQYKKAVRAYLASISFADALVGRLLDALEASPHGTNTVVVVWSDHGWHLGEKQAWHKRTLWQRATQVPLILSAPGMSQAGGKCVRPVNLVDLFPTLVELCGLTNNPRLDGASLVPLLRDPESAWERASLTTNGLGNHAVSTERWRYIRYADGSEELYDRMGDPHEWKNLAGEPAYEETKRELMGRLPKEDAPGALSKGAYDFDPETYSWRLKEGWGQ